MYTNLVFFKNKTPKLVAVSKKQEDYKVDKALAWDKKFLVKIEYKKQQTDGKKTRNL